MTHRTIVNLKLYLQQALDQFGRAEVIRTMHEIMVDRAKERAETEERRKDA